MNKQIAIDLSKLKIINEINELKSMVNNQQPISIEIQNKVFQKLKLDWNYNSNAIEGNQLNYGETVAFLMHGITAKGKTLKDHLDIKGHNEAITFLLSIIKENRDISESDIRALHQLILVEEYKTDAITTDGLPTKKTIKLGTYKTTPNSVKTKTGEMHYYATPEETPFLMQELLEWYNESKINSEIHPIVLAALFHYRFVAIHPFDDGNGRLARILMNLILMRAHYLPIVVKNEDKLNYYGVLAQADVQQYIPLIEYMSELLKHTLNIQLKAINGESIEEESDIDKEIELLKRSLDKNVLERRKYNIIDVQNRLKDSILIIVNSIYNNIEKLKELFYAYNFDIGHSNNGGEFIEIVNDSFNNYKVWPFLSNGNRVLGSKNHITYFIKLNEYRNATDLNISMSVDILFNEFDYIVKTDNIKIKKHYNETISNEEINTFVNATMKDILNEIKKHTKQN